MWGSEAVGAAVHEQEQWEEVVGRQELDHNLVLVQHSRQNNVVNGSMALMDVDAGWNPIKYPLDRA